MVGVHTPEFAFEKNIDNVRRARRTMGVGYPVAIDKVKKMRVALALGK